MAVFCCSWTFTHCTITVDLSRANEQDRQSARSTTNIGPTQMQCKHLVQAYTPSCTFEAHCTGATWLPLLPYKTHRLGPHWYLLACTPTFGKVACLCLLMRKPDSKFQYIQQAPTDICLLVPPHIWKSCLLYTSPSPRD